MSNNNEPNKQESSNISPMFTVPPSSITSIPPPSPVAFAAFYQSYIQAAAMYASHQQQHQQQFFQHMFSVPPPPLPTSNASSGNRPSLSTDNSQRRSIDVRQISTSKNDYQDRKRKFFSPSSLRDNNNKQIGNKRLYNFDQSSRNDDRKIPRREPLASPAPKRRRINNDIIEDEYHDSSSDEDINDVSTTKIKPQYVRTCASELYYRRDEQNSRLIHATQKLKDLCVKFRSDVLAQREIFRKENKIFDEPDHSNMFHKAKQISSNIKSNKSKIKSKDTSSESGEEEEEEEEGEEEGEATAASLASDNLLTLEIERKQQISNRLHPELWFNEYKQGNDGPICRCSNDDRKFGIRHQMFYGEKSITPCDKWNNNTGRLFHYRITLTPETNFIVTLIEEASKAISYALTTLIWSIITFILNDRPIYQINCNQDFGQSYQNESSHSYVILNALTKLNISSISKTCLDYNEGDNCNSDDFSQLNCSIDRIRYVYISYDFVDETFENYLNTV
ncbi:unnamed protein product [Rotaria sp. Silwood2]|nr:unnamed protein product [Rotaria sp. Silwood2]